MDCGITAPLPHLILLPSLGIGHLIPFTELAKRLAARGFLVSFFVSANHGLSIARTKIADAANIRIVELHLSQEIKPEAIEHISNASDQIPPILLSNHTVLQDAFHKLLFSEDNDNGFQLNPPLCIVTDFLLCWTVSTAAKLGIPRVSVECSSAYSQNFFEILWSNLPRNLERTNSGRYIVPHDAKCTLFSRSQMPSELPDADETHWLYVGSRECFRLMKQSWMSITNTFDAVEGDHVDEFQRRYPGPVRPIGPLLPQSFLSGQYLTTPAAQLAAAELEWLDDRSPGSVVYVSFGTQCFISSSQIIELALGLEASGKPFLWVLKLPDSDENKLELDDFYRRTERQGLILSGWTDQLAILSHPSVGAFISHCGWNSGLEAISIGVPLICWPLVGDQYFNTRLIVEEVKVGIKVVKREEDEMVTRDEIEKCVRTLMDDGGSGDDKAKSLKENCKRLKELAREAVSEDGSSSKNFDMFVEDILSLQKKMTIPTSNSM